MLSQENLEFEIVFKFSKADSNQAKLWVNESKRLPIEWDMLLWNKLIYIVSATPETDAKSRQFEMWIAFKFSIANSNQAKLLVSESEH